MRPCPRSLLIAGAAVFVTAAAIGTTVALWPRAAAPGASPEPALREVIVLFLEALGGAVASGVHFVRAMRATESEAAATAIGCLFAVLLIAGFVALSVIVGSIAWVPAPSVAFPAACAAVTIAP